MKDSHNTGIFLPNSFSIIIAWTFKHGRYYETGLTVYSSYLTRIESLTICRCNCKGSTFSSVILRPRVMVWPDSNSWPPVWQPDGQPTEPQVWGFDWHAVISTTKKKIMGSQAGHHSRPWQVTPTTIILQYWTDLQVVKSCCEAYKLYIVLKLNNKSILLLE